MGLCIRLTLASGKNICVYMRYSSFHQFVMAESEMIEWKFSDCSGFYRGRRLQFLVDKLIQSAYLKPEILTSKPVRAAFS